MLKTPLEIGYLIFQSLLIAVDGSHEGWLKHESRVHKWDLAEIWLSANGQIQRCKSSQPFCHINTYHFL